MGLADSFIAQYLSLTSTGTLKSRLPILTTFYKSQRINKGDGTSVAVLHLYDSKLGTYTTLGLKNKGRE
jgi:hypothetical protein